MARHDSLIFLIINLSSAVRQNTLLLDCVGSFRLVVEPKLKGQTDSILNKYK